MTIEGNVVEDNDLAFDLTSPEPNTACPASPTDADDCGEGIHLLGATYSSVIRNKVSHNIGGILVSDGGLAPTSVGPAAHNVIAYNAATENAVACGSRFPATTPERSPQKNSRSRPWPASTTTSSRTM